MVFGCGKRIMTLAGTVHLVARIPLFSERIKRAGSTASSMDFVSRVLSLSWEEEVSRRGSGSGEGASSGSSCSSGGSDGTIVERGEEKR
ncbi:hypothetical protein HZH68_007602 [Vespula germanica]|uniref:Uncharacterized protein n=1 Tax=Vespula germanica TaxID=30212 RepID=A0A834K802_VESGE|nr:hypothetical protein HZH68_007602 [Vespula germanica]